MSPRRKQKATTSPSAASCAVTHFMDAKGLEACFSVGTTVFGAGGSISLDVINSFASNA
jgi:hypothetical protein